MKVKEIGNLVADPRYGEKAKSNGENGVTKYCNFRIAISDPYDRNKTEYADVVAFGKKAELCSTWLQKGSQICIEGNIAAKSYISPDGKASASIQIKAQEVQFLNRTKTKEQVQEQQQGRQQKQPRDHDEQPQEPPEPQQEPQQKMSIADRKAAYTAQAKAQSNEQPTSRDAMAASR